MIIIGTPEQIGAILCGEQDHNEHTKAWRWHAYIGDTKARMRAVDEVARQMIARANAGCEAADRFLSEAAE